MQYAAPFVPARFPLTNLPKLQSDPGTPVPKGLAQIRRSGFLSFKLRVSVGVTRLVFWQFE